MTTGKTLDLELDKHKDNLNVQLAYFFEELFRKETLESDVEFYNGDLSGGRVLAKKLQKHIEPPEDRDVAFCQFDTVENRNMFKELFRKKLNQVEVTSICNSRSKCRVKCLRRRLIYSKSDDDIEGPTLFSVPML
ncbi:hypothetical protein BG006_003058 [Podila minutissima]|uniref:Uncharacterized protein n=1 Tax=Podila minutissima TaxID=64525 RepID=A0A9P5SRS8_9FUNG|nr:hypothetical protein BG006_003058 [Podila minutissima]